MYPCAFDCVIIYNTCLSILLSFLLLSLLSPAVLGGCLSRVLDEDFYKQPFSELIGYVYVAPTNILQPLPLSFFKSLSSITYITSFSFSQSSHFRSMPPRLISTVLHFNCPFQNCSFFPFAWTCSVLNTHFSFNRSWLHVTSMNAFQNEIRAMAACRETHVVFVAKFIPSRCRFWFFSHCSPLCCFPSHILNN